MDKEYVDHLEELLISYATYILTVRKILTEEQKREINYAIRSKNV